jgi:hypothetical protein
MKSIKVISGIIILILLAGRGAAAEARNDSTNVDEKYAESDTLTGPESSDTENRWQFTPKWSVNSSAGMSTINLSSGMNMVIEPGGGWVITSNVMVGEKKYRTRDMVDLTEKFNNSAMKIVPGLYVVSFRLGEDYRKSKTVSLSRFGKDIVFENERVGGDFKYMKPVLKAKRSLFNFKGDYVRGEHDFKYDRKMSGDASGYLSYALGDNFTFGGGYGVFISREGSEIGPIEFNNIPSWNDTFKVNAGYKKSADQFLTVNYERKTGDIKRVDPPRGNSLEILDNPELAKREKIDEKGEVLTIHSGFVPASFVKLDIKFDHSLDDRKYDVDTRLSKKYERNNLNAKTVYKFSKEGSATFTFEKAKTDVDYGINSVSSYSEDENKLGFRASQKLGKGWDISANGRMSLKQKFYKKYKENPRDVDYYYYGGGVKMNANPFKNVDARVEIKASRYETSNIDRSLSSDNHVEYIYRLMPGFTVRPFSWLTLSQAYEVKMEYTEFTFDENRNYLDRTTLMNTNAKMNFQKGLSFGFDHTYDMRDTGSYLTVGNEKHYNRISENFKHQMKMNVDYKAASFLDLFSSAFFRLRQNNQLGVENGERVITKSTLYDSGTLRIGFKGKKKVLGKGNMNLDVAYVRNYGHRISDAMRKFWEINMKLVFEF